MPSLYPVSLHEPKGSNPATFPDCSVLMAFSKAQTHHLDQKLVDVDVFLPLVITAAKMALYKSELALASGVHTQELRLELIQLGIDCLS